MQALEFNTIVDHRSITIPDNIKDIDNVVVKVIIIYEEKKPNEGNYDKQALLSLFAQAEQKGAFSGIGNAVDWQKQQRDEWE